MKPLHLVHIVFGALIFLMIGCFLFFGVGMGLSSAEDAYKDLLRLFQHRFLSSLAGIAFLSAGYYTIKTVIKRSSRDEIYVVDGEYGRTSISLMAIEDLIRKMIKRNEYIKRSRIRMSVNNKNLVVNVSLVIYVGKAAAEIVEEVQSELRRKLANFIGVPQEQLNITVKVTKVYEQKDGKGVS